MMPKTLPGNCLVCVLLFKAVYGGKLRTIKLREGGTRHWIIKLPSGETWHFKRSRNIMPGPMKNLLFLGKFERLVPR